MMQIQPIRILLVEDDPADQKLIKTSLKNQKIANDLYVVSSGEEAFDFLQHKGDYGKDDEGVCKNYIKIFLNYERHKFRASQVFPETFVCKTTVNKAFYAQDNQHERKKIKDGFQ